MLLCCCVIVMLCCCVVVLSCCCFVVLLCVGVLVCCVAVLFCRGVSLLVSCRVVLSCCRPVALSCCCCWFVGLFCCFDGLLCRCLRCVFCIVAAAFPMLRRCAAVWWSCCVEYAFVGLLYCRAVQL